MFLGSSFKTAHMAENCISILEIRLEHPLSFLLCDRGQAGCGFWFVEHMEIKKKNNWLRLKLQRGNSWDRKVRKLSIHQHRCIFSILNLSSNCYANPLSICTWFLQFSSLKYPVWWTWILVYFKLEFYKLHLAEKSSSNLERNSVHQTRYFNLENCKNKVQIDRGTDFWHLQLISSVEVRFELGKNVDWLRLVLLKLCNRESIKRRC